MLVESEAPFMVPSSYRGKRNRPSYLLETVKFIAELRKLPAEELAETLYQNSLRFFGLSDGQRKTAV
jgi:TatD DNase family protein